jgi:hypothetical protein
VSKKTHILKDDFKADYYSLGLSTSESVFQLIMHLNVGFGFSLKLVEPLHIKINNECIDFPCGLHFEDDILKVRLIKQKVNGKILLKQFPMMDYILVVSGENAILVFEKIQSQIRTFPNISITTPIVLSKLKSISTLL